MKFILISNLQTVLIVTFANFLRTFLLICGGMYIWQVIGSGELAIGSIVVYLLAQGFVNYFGMNDVIYVSKEEMEEVENED